MTRRSFTIPFAAGQDEKTAKRMLPAGALLEAVNVRQRHDQSFGVRPDYPAVALDTFDTTNLVPLELFELNGRMVALGDSLDQRYPTDVFEFVQLGGGTWKATQAVGAQERRIPPVINVRNVGKVPDGIDDIDRARVAAANGLVCVVHGGSGNYVHIFKAETDTTVLFEPTVLANARVVVVGDSFWVIGCSGGVNNLTAMRFDTLVDDNFQAPVTLYVGTVTTNIFQAVAVSALPVATFAVFLRDGSTTVIRHFDEAGTQVQTWAGPAVAATVLDIEADLAKNQTVVIYRVGAADVFVQTYTTSTHASVAGPTAVFGQAMTGDIGINRIALGDNFLDIYAEDDTKLIRRNLINSTSHAGTVTVMHNYTLAGRGVTAQVTGTQTMGVLVPVQSNADNQLVLMQPTVTGNALQSTVKLDNGVGVDGAFTSGGDTAKDLSTQKFYWVRLIEGTDGQRIPIVAEFDLGVRQRRQAAQSGNSLFISGGMPLSYDGHQLSESGFTEKPVFQSSASVTNGGSLIEGAEYDYVAVYKWTDAQNRQAQSEVSAITTLTIGAGNNGTTHEIYAPHTLRRDASTGSATTISLYRTFATLEETPAVVIGENSISPPAGVLNGLTLRINDGDGAIHLVTFGAGDTTSAAILATINAVTSAEIVATAPSGLLVLTSVDLGTSAIVQVLASGSANAILGFTQADLMVDTGESTFTKGTVFQLAATATVPIADAYGEPVTVADTLSDDLLLTREPLYTQGERGAQTGILEHDPPPACKYAFAVGSRVFVGGLADRSAVAISKLLAPGEALAFSDNFSFNSTVDGDVTAVGGLDGTPIAFTQQGVYAFSNQLPNDIGEDGELGEAKQIPSEGGCSNQHSIVETSFGLFYQARDAKLMLLPRGGGVPVWIGRPVQDTLALFPDITSATYVDLDHVVCFTCRDSGDTSSVILVFDLRNGQWYKDTFATPQSIASSCSHDGRLAYISWLGSGSYIDTAVIRLQSLSLIPAAFISSNSKTGSIEPFDGNGWGKFISVTVNGEFRGNARLRVQISYDDGQTFTTMTEFDVTAAAGYVAGESIQFTWFPARRKGGTYVLNFEVRPDGAATASEGLILNQYTCVVEGDPIIARLPSAQRG